VSLRADAMLAPLKLFPEMSSISIFFNMSPNPTR